MHVGLDADRRDHREHHPVAAPPMTGPGTLATTWPIFGSSPSRSSMTPQVVTTRPAAHPGQPDQADVLREGGVGGREFQESGQHRRQAVGGQAAGQVGGGELLVDHLGDGQHVGG